MEDFVYRCGWKRTADGYEVWLKSPPRARAHGRTIQEAEEALIEATIDAGGAMCPAMEFVPPLPVSDFDRRYTQPAILEIVGDGSVESDEPRGGWFEPEEERIERERWFDDFYTVRLCPYCGISAGRRSDRPVLITHVEAGYEGGSARYQGMDLRVFSERFLDLLTDEERRGLELQPVSRPARARKKFYELTGPSGPPLVGVANLEMSGWRCIKCGSTSFGFRPEGVVMSEFVARGDLNDPLPEVSTIGIQPRVKLCMTAARWAQIAEERGTRGVLSSPIGVVPDEELVREPVLRQLGAE